MHPIQDPSCYDLNTLRIIPTKLVRIVEKWIFDWMLPKRIIRKNWNDSEKIGMAPGARMTCMQKSRGVSFAESGEMERIPWVRNKSMPGMEEERDGAGWEG